MSEYQSPYDFHNNTGYGGSCYGEARIDKLTFEEAQRIIKLTIGEGHEIPFVYSPIGIAYEWKDYIVLFGSRDNRIFRKENQELLYVDKLPF